MLVLALQERARAPRVVAFSRSVLMLGRSFPELTLGGAGSPDFAIADENCLARHLTFFETAGHLHVHPWGATLLDGEVISGKSDFIVPVGSVLQIGKTTIRVDHFTPVVPPDFREREADFLAEIEGKPHAIPERLVYADALEEGGWLLRAEYLRVQLRLLLGEAIAGDEDAKRRLANLLTAAADWRAAVGEPRSP